MTEATRGPDPRFGWAAPVAATTRMRTPGGRTLLVTQARAVTLTAPSDVLSVSAASETTTVNGRVHTSLFSAATHTITSTSPAGRQTVTTLDALGRPASVQVATLTPTSFAYDAAGRLQSTIWPAACRPSRATARWRSPSATTPTAIARA